MGRPALTAAYCGYRLIAFGIGKGFVGRLVRPLSARLPLVRLHQKGGGEQSNEGVKPMKRAGILVGPRRCIGCHACGVACKTEHDVPLGGFRIRTHYLQRTDRPTHFLLPTMCQHCQDAPCIPACPNDGVVRLADRRVEINKVDCRTDMSCIKACPYDAIYIDEQMGKADKCNLCTPCRSPHTTIRRPRVV